MAKPIPNHIRVQIDALADEGRPSIERLQAGAALARSLDGWLPELAEQARGVEGASWSSIGSALAITRQAAQQRFGLRRKEARRYNTDPADAVATRPATA